MPVQTFTAAMIMKPDLMPELVRVTDEDMAMRESIARQALYFRVDDYYIEDTPEGPEYKISEYGRNESLSFTCVDRLYTPIDIVKELDRALLAYPDTAILNEEDNRTKTRLQNMRQNFNDLASVFDEFPDAPVSILIVDPILMDSPPNYRFVDMDYEKVYDAQGQQLWPVCGPSAPRP